MLQNAGESVVVLSIKDTPSAEREGADAKQAGHRLLQAGAYHVGSPSRGSDAAAAAQALNPGALMQGAACDWVLLLRLFHSGLFCYLIVISVLALFTAD